MSMQGSSGGASGSLVCSKCGSQNSAGARFCYNCGNPLSAPTPPPDATLVVGPPPQPNYQQPNYSQQPGYSPQQPGYSPQPNYPQQPGYSSQQPNYQQPGQPGAPYGQASPYPAQAGYPASPAVPGTGAPARRKLPLPWIAGGVALLVVLLLFGLAGGDSPQELLVGSWTPTGALATELPPGAQLQFTEDGELRINGLRFGTYRALDDQRVILHTDEDNLDTEFRYTVSEETLTLSAEGETLSLRRAGR